ncbi:MAG: SDR family NAD(P)-dependent oxidoreductase [Myxococcota bacterium]
MAKTIVVCGYGPGISDGVARRFASEGFQVALVARSAERSNAAAAELTAAGHVARAYQADLGDAGAVAALVAKVRSELGPVTVIHWNALAFVAGDLLTASPAEMRTTFDVAVNGLVAAVQAALPDLRAQSGTSGVLVTGGGFAGYDPQLDELIAKIDVMGLGLAKAAQRKLTGLLHAKLKPEGVYVGEVVVLGAVVGTTFDRGDARIQPSAVADAFWKQYTGRAGHTVSVG